MLETLQKLVSRCASLQILISNGKWWIVARSTCGKELFGERLSNCDWMITGIWKDANIQSVLDFFNVLWVMDKLPDFVFWTDQSRSGVICKTLPPKISKIGSLTVTKDFSIQHLPLSMKTLIPMNNFILLGILDKNGIPMLRKQVDLKKFSSEGIVQMTANQDEVFWILARSNQDIFGWIPYRYFKGIDGVFKRIKEYERATQPVQDKVLDAITFGIEQIIHTSKNRNFINECHKLLGSKENILQDVLRTACKF